MVNFFLWGKLTHLPSYFSKKNSLRSGIPLSDMHGYGLYLLCAKFGALINFDTIRLKICSKQLHYNKLLKKWAMNKKGHLFWQLVANGPRNFGSENFGPWHEKVENHWNFSISK